MRISPSVRISVGLVSLTISLLLLAKMLGFAPDQNKIVLESRKNLSEAIAMQLSYDVSSGRISGLQATLAGLASRTRDMQSAAVRDSSGELIAEVGDHIQHWNPPTGTTSNIDNIQVPVFRGKQQWATIEISFAPVSIGNLRSGLKNSYLSLILFVGMAGFAGYLLMMKRTLRELDPTTVIPQRVQAAFDVLKEGVLILDEKEQIVLANKSFAEAAGKQASDLIGLKGSELGWKGFKNPAMQERLPWAEVLRETNNSLGTRLILEGGALPQTTFMVNAAPVMDGRNKCRGVLVTLDDLTELEEKNIELSEAVNQLQLTTEEIQSKNKELEFLATHDPMTQLLNRRALGSEFKKIFNDAQQNDRQLSCIMCDIDHFKSVNDKYGHATGDKVIQAVAAVLKKNTRKKDLIGRYGGEEFCIVLVDLGADQATSIANRMRQAIKDDMSCGVPITGSFGVSSLRYNAAEPDELANQADKALYVAKESGRNRVVCWGSEEVAYLSPEQKEAQGKKQGQKETIEKVKKSSAALSRLTVRLQQLEELAEKRTQELKHQTAYDALTGLPNRTLFNDRLQQALLRGNRYDHIVAVLSMSVQTIQRINDVMGHEAGDLLFRDISRRLSGILRAMDTVTILSANDSEPTLARLGHDDFGILLVGVERVDAVTWIVKRILDSFDQSFQVEGKEIYATASVGVSIYPFDGESTEELEKNATIARRHAQNTLGENKYYFYSDKLNKSSRKHLELENQLHDALKNEELSLHYQPKLSTASVEIIGMEALIRWNNPEIGPVPPYEFIPIAEYSGLIVPIGEWVLRAACKQTRQWLDMGFPGCNIAVNFSAKQFRELDLAEKIAAALEENQLPPHYLTVEITESLMMENIHSSLQMLRKIHDIGVNIALDDFGTGYSSLSYLKNFPLTHVKIDRSFIADIETNSKDAIMVESIINMAHGIDLKVTAEGVETKDQAKLLRQYGCDELQGFLFSRPVSAKDATSLLQNMDQFREIS